MFRELSMNALSTSRFTLNTLSLSRFYYLFTVSFSNSPWIHFFAKSQWTHYFFAISLWNHYIFRKFTFNTLSFSRIFYVYTIYFAILLWIHNSFCREITVNSLSFSKIYFKYTICFAISLLIYYLFRLFTINCFVNSLYIKNYFSGLARINYCFRDSTLNSLSILRTQFEYAPFIANLLRIMTHSRNHDGMLT